MEKTQEVFKMIFNKTATEIGATVRSSEMEAQDAEASRDEALALEDERLWSIFR